MRRRVIAAVALALALGSPATLAAQSAKVLLAEGIAAYHELDLAAATRLLHRALDERMDPPLGADARDRAHIYLGATHVALGESDAAADAFRTLIVQNPAYRADTLVFPPPVTAQFRQARETTKAAAATMPARTRLVIGQGSLPITLTVSSPHFVTVGVDDAGGRALQAVYDGPVHDTLTVAWDGLDADGQPVAAGRYVLRVVSYVSAGRPLRSVRIPLTIAAETAGSLVPPRLPQDSLLPERRGGQRRTDLAATAFLLSAVALAPVAFGTTDHETPRIVLGVSTAGLGLFGLLWKPGSQPIPANIAHNDAVRRRYREAVARTERENARRRNTRTLTIRVGTALRLEGR